MLRDLARRKIARKIACRVSVPMQAKSNANSSEFECNFLISFDAGKTLKIVRGLTNCTQPSSVVYLLTCRICLNFVEVSPRPRFTIIAMCFCRADRQRHPRQKHGVWKKNPPVSICFGSTGSSAVLELHDSGKAKNQMSWLTQYRIKFIINFGDSRDLWFLFLLPLQSLYTICARKFASI